MNSTVIKPVLKLHAYFILCTLMDLNVSFCSFTFLTCFNGSKQNLQIMIIFLEKSIVLLFSVCHCLSFLWTLLSLPFFPSCQNLFLMQAMKVLSKKRLMRQAGFPRKSEPNGFHRYKLSFYYYQKSLFCPSSCPSLIIISFFLLLQGDRLLVEPKLFLRVLLNLKGHWSEFIKKLPFLKSWTILM